MKVVCVLRSGGEYDAGDVRALAEQLRRHAPDAELTCLSDVPVPTVDTVPLLTDWPGWWAKMEMFGPTLRGPFLYVDLDTLLVGDLSDVLARTHLTIMRDVYRPKGLQSSIMWIPEGARAAVWQRFTSAPEAHMARHRVGGDQTYLEEHWLGKTDIWQDVLPGQIVSYKADEVRSRGLSKGARVVIFHGRPKPREIGWRV